MAMRLLPKSEIDRAKAAEKRSEIDEGLKLARRVDNLREVAAEEEKALETFRRETVANIHEEITKENQTLIDLKSEVRDLEDRRERALKPLDEERKQLSEEARQLEEARKEHEKAKGKLEADKSDVAATQQSVANLLRRALERDADSRTRLFDAARADEDAAAHTKIARQIEKSTRDKKERVEAELTHREQLVIDRENGATIKETEISAREKELADGWRLLKDREATLERNYARLKK